jgi:hypothetical protein
MEYSNKVEELKENENNLKKELIMLYKSAL